jgi:iron complex outermembrane receptor protein
MKPSERLTPALLAVIFAATPAAAPVAAQVRDTLAIDSVTLYKLEGITVTVSRWREDLNRLPYAAGLLGKADLQGLDATVSLDESLAQIPGVLVNNRHNFALGVRISVRGFGARSQFGVRGVRIIQDGIPLTLPDGQAQTGNLDLGAAGRIEVIRGPASALYGNASGGVISVQTESAPLVPFRPELGVLAGGYGNDHFYQKYDLKLGGRQGRFDYLGHFSYFDSDGFRTHSEARHTLLNTRLRYELSRDSDLTLVVNYADAPQAQNPSSLTDSIARVKPDTVRDIVLPPEDCPPDPGFGGCQNLGEEFRQGQAGLAYRRAFGGAHEISLMGYGLFRELENRIPFRLIELDRLGGGARAEYRLTPTAGRLSRFSAGVDLDGQKDDRVERLRDAETVGPVALDQDEGVASLGLFAHGGLVLAPGLGLTVSLRYDRVRFDVDDRLVTEDDPDDSGARTMDQWSPMAGLSYSYAPWLNVYGNVGRSFQTPTTTELTDTLGGFNPDLQPERATNYEVGLKGSAGRRVSYSLALFHADVEDQLIGFAAAGIERVYFENAGSSVHDGIEAGISALVAPGWTASLAYTYSNFKFDEFVTDAGDFSGNRVPGVPPHQLHARLGYARGTGPSGSLRLTATDDYFVDSANENRNDGYAIVDLRLGYTAHTAGFEIVPFLGINNILDVRYNSSVVVNAIAGRYYEPAPGRNLYAGLRLRTR